MGVDGVFKISPTTHQVTTVFNTSDYSNYLVAPGLVEGSDGNFYGSTLYLRGLQYLSGAIFQVTPSGQVTFTQFQVLAGTGPMIQASNGTFYGIGATFNDIGTMSPGIVFSYTPNGFCRYPASIWSGKRWSLSRRYRRAGTERRPIRCHLLGWNRGWGDSLRGLDAWGLYHPAPFWRWQRSK